MVSSDPKGLRGVLQFRGSLEKSVIAAGSQVNLKLLAIMSTLISLVNSQTHGQRLVFTPVGEAISNTIANYPGAGPTNVGATSGCCIGPYSAAKYMLFGAWFKVTCTAPLAVAIPVPRASTSHFTYTNLGELRVVGQAPYNAMEYRTAPCNTWLGVAFRYLVPTNGVLGSIPEAVQYLGPFKDYTTPQTPYYKITPLTASGQLYFAAFSGVTVYNQFYFMDHTNQLQYPPGSGTGNCSKIENFCTKGVMSSFLQILGGPINPIPLVHLNLYKYFTLPFKYNGNTVATGSARRPYVTPNGMKMNDDKNYSFPDLISFPNVNGASMVRPCIIIRVHLATGPRQYRDQKAEYRFSLGKGTVWLLDNFKLEFKFKYGDKCKTEFSQEFDSNLKCRMEWDFTEDLNNPQFPTISFKVCYYAHAFTAYYQVFFGTRSHIPNYVPPDSWGQITTFAFRPDASGYTGGPLDFSVNFNKDNTGLSYEYYMRAIRVHEGGMLGSMAELMSPVSPSNLCLESSYTVPQSFTPLTYYCLICTKPAVNIDGTCINYDPPSAGITFPTTALVPEDLTRVAYCKPATYMYNLIGYDCQTPAGCPADWIKDTAKNYCSSPLSNYCGLFQTRDVLNNCVCSVTNCATCTNAACSQCLPNFYLKIGGNTVSCIASISTGFGYDTSSGSLNIIRPCTTFGCLDCSYNYLNCYSCGAVTWPDLCPVTAKPCPPECASCKPLSPITCLTCNAGYLLAPSTSTCVLCTAPGFYATATDCLPCNSACATCSGPTNKNCLSCPISPTITYLQLDNGCGPCDTTQSRFLDPTNSNKCTPCAATFLTCNSATSTGGLTCIAGYNPTPGPPLVCSSACLASQYATGGAPTCAGCLTQCATCTSGTTCSTCQMTHPFYQPWDQNCVASCIGQTYQASSGLCGQCDTTCQTCEGVALTQCLTCPTNKYLLKNPPTATSGACTSCDTDPSYVISGLNCVQCAVPCLTCSGIANTQCLSCLPTYTLSGNVPGTCVICNTAGSQFLNPIDDMCYNCDATTCLTCAGSATSCLICAAGLFKYPDGSCGSCTEPGYYQYNDGISRCAPCSMGCLQCSGSPTNCQMCDNDNQFYNVAGVANFCALCDLQTSFLQGNICTKCSSNCASCQNSATYCTSCPKGKYLYVRDNTCGNCKNEVGFYKDAITDPSMLLCSACLPECASCSNTIVCESCIQGQYLYANKSCSVCTAQNEAITGTSCVNCDSSCLTCKGPLQTDCLTCTFEKYLSPQNECIKRNYMNVESRTFAADLMQASFLFNTNIESTVGDLNEAAEVAIFSENQEVCFNAANKSSTGLDTTPGLTKLEGYSVDSLRISGKYLHATVKGSKTIKDGTLVIRFKKIPSLQKLGDKNTIYREKTLVINPVNLIITALDGALDAAAAPVSTAMTTMTTFIFLISIPQAFVLMKVFQTIDFYVYVDCDYPSNFSKFLEIISKNIMDYVPNFLKELADEEGSPIYPRFSQFGQNVHVFQNLGPLFTVVCCLFGVKLILKGLSLAFKSNKRFRSMLLSNHRMERRYRPRSLAGNPGGIPHGYLAVDCDSHYVPRHCEQLRAKPAICSHRFRIAVGYGTRFSVPAHGIHSQPTHQSLQRIWYP